MKKIKIYGISFLFCFCLGACTEWFDVEPKRLTDESELFSSEQGFKEALTGIYIKAAKDDLYGSYLTYSFLDLIAQQYTAYSYVEYYDFSTSSTYMASYINTIWSSTYNLIANINNLLWWVDERKDVLVTPTYYEIIKGEALAFRSYLYFDLLRMFGPVYSQSPTGRSVPYRTEFNRDIIDLENADSLLEYIIADLLEAHDLLAEADNLNFDYTEDGANKTEAAVGENAFLVFRFKRMNYLATKALLARIYLYKGDKVNAAKYAYEVIESGKFQILSTLNPSVRDPKCELIFGLHYNETLSRENKMLSSAFNIRTQAAFNEIFEVDTYGLNDIRIRESSGFVEEYGNFFSLKYDITGVARALQYTVPMLKVSEMYYIAAECTDDLVEARTLLDEVRTPRGLDMLQELTSEEQRLAELEIEYRKEFYAEGQLWYFYKRNFYRTFRNCPIENMTEDNYIFKIPDNEYLFGAIAQ